MQKNNTKCDFNYMVQNWAKVNYIAQAYIPKWQNYEEAKIGYYKKSE